MSREIKFRAWDKEKGQMLPVTLMDFNEWWISCKPVTDIKASPLEYGERNSFKNENTDRHILMQYIRLKDVVNKDIYEGDIVKNRFFDENQNLIAEEINVVDFDRGSFVFAPALKHRGLSLDEFSNRYHWKYIEYEIVGNIYEDSELLKVNDKSNCSEGKCKKESC